jgi:hypothetical protein
MASEQRKAQWRESRRRARARARDEHRCISCLQVRLAADRVTCERCGERANAAKRRRMRRLASSALARASAFGIDVGLLLRNLRLSPEQRFAEAERSLRNARTLARIAHARTP